jgi:hypothetical protein
MRKSFKPIFTITNQISTGLIRGLAFRYHRRESLGYTHPFPIYNI